MFQTIFKSQPSALRELVELAWNFVTLPSPIIVHEPETFTEKTHERQFAYWNPETPKAPLIYLRPVVYRSYQGTLACKAWVANTRPSQQQKPTNVGAGSKPEVPGQQKPIPSANGADSKSQGQQTCEFQSKMSADTHQENETTTQMKVTVL